ncbi:MAG: xanthine dehydrogenase family protein subunit M [Calditrichaeota bacterium]|nr:MAG: xanthine dehydrogenase family protein subunit M [Calditrichota bacterium]
MIPAKFDYVRASSVDEALNLLREFGDDAKVLAGGHSLLPSMKLRLSTPAKVIDIGKLDELKYIKDEGDVIAIGAGSTHRDIATSSELSSKAPLLQEAAAAIGDVQVRNMGTIGGSLAHADPAADYPAALLAAEAEIVVKGSGGQRTISALDFFLGLYLTALQPDELILEVRVPVQPDGAGSAYLKFPHPASRFAVVGCAAMVHKSGGVCDLVRVAFTGVADHAFRDSNVESALNGKALDESTVSAAADLAAQGVDLMGDAFASEDYRQHLAKVYAKRAILEAAERASG